MTTEKKHDRETVLDAINGTGIWSPAPGENKITHSFGNVTVIAARLGVSRQTVYSYMREWATVDTAIKEGRQTLNDLVENKMAQKMIGGDTTMIIFYAKTQMYDRGYVERHHMQNMNIDISQLSTEQLERIAKGEDVYSVIANPGAS